jgi:hypothetical protein
VFLSIAVTIPAAGRAMIAGPTTRGRNSGMKTTLGRMLFAAAILSGPLLSGLVATSPAATIDGPSQELRVRQTTYVDGPRTAAGDIDYPAALNVHYGRGVSPEQNACLALWRVLGPSAIDDGESAAYFSALGVKPPDAEGDYFVEYENSRRRKNRRGQNGEAPLLRSAGRDLRETREQPWTREEFPDVAAWLDTQDGPLAKVARAARLPHFYDPAGFSSAGFDGYRRLTEAFLTRAMLLAGERRIDEAIADLTTCRRLARLTAQGSSMEYYQEAAILELDTIDAEVAVVAQAVGGAEHSERRLAELQSLAPFPPPMDKLEFSARFEILGLLQGMARGDRSSLEFYGYCSADTSYERLTATFASFNYEPALRYANDAVDRIVAASRVTDPAERRTRLLEIGERLRSNMDAQPTDGTAIGRRLTGAYLYPTPATYTLHDRVLQANGQVRLAHRLAAYRARRGRYPASLAELAAPAEETTDIFGGGPLVYRADADGVLVYGVGEDGVDDGGRNYRDDGESDADDIRIRLNGPGAMNAAASTVRRSDLLRK